MTKYDINLPSRPFRPVGTDFNQGGFPPDRATVAVVIPTFNHARFLADAIRSVLQQTRPADEIIVVDDGSTDDPATVVAQFPGVQLVRQDNRGLSAARNAGLWACNTTYVVFLDADDRLLPVALDVGLTFMAARPHCAFVYGGYRFVSESGNDVSPDCINLIDEDAHLALIRRNRIGMCATVLYRRDCLLAVNGFDEALRRLEDHDIYLRIARRYPVASHPTVVAEYRKHGQNMSNDYVAQLEAALRLFDVHESRIPVDARTRAALRDGRANMRSYYVSEMLTAAATRWKADHNIAVLVTDLIEAARWASFVTVRALLHVLYRRAIKVLTQAVVRRSDQIGALSNLDQTEGIQRSRETDADLRRLR